MTVKLNRPSSLSGKPYSAIADSDNSLGLYRGRRLSNGPSQQPTPGLKARVKELARGKGIVLTHLPALAGVSPSHFWDVMRGRKAPTVRWLANLGAALGCTPVELLGGGPRGSSAPPPARRGQKVPLVSLRSEAGPFIDPEAVESWGEIRARTRRALTPGMFAMVVSGRSMEPKIRDGSICLFRVMDGRNPHGKVVLLQLRGGRDPETGGRYTVKRFKVTAKRGKKVTRVRLEPLNREFEAMVLEKEPMRQLTAVAEFLEVLVPASR